MRGAKFALQMSDSINSILGSQTFFQHLSGRIEHDSIFRDFLQEKILMSVHAFFSQLLYLAHEDGCHHQHVRQMDCPLRIKADANEGGEDGLEEVGEDGLEEGGEDG